VTRVEPLARHLRFVPALVEVFTREWPEWAHRAGAQAVAASFEENPDPGLLPRVFVARDGDTVQGTIALRPWFGEERMRETPWVRGLYVLPPFRGRGIDRLLIAAVERQATELGAPELFAATNAIERLLVRRGWRVFHRLQHEGEPMAWLRKDLTSAR
jgi:GNAT superfamily N-acetyltransferase